MTTTTAIEPRFVGLQDAATWLGISHSTIRRRIADGSLPAFKVAGSQLRVRVADLDRLVVPVGGGLR